jgi:hypothetical protein
LEKGGVWTGTSIFKWKNKETADAFNRNIIPTNAQVPVYLA